MQKDAMTTGDGNNAGVAALMVQTQSTMDGGEGERMWVV
jgi:hypothetical protein